MSMNKKAFTIIEVVLVLAIGGLIFLMVFIALPALQRSQRNSQRRNDVDRVYQAIIEYQKHNSGKLPFVDNKYDKNFVPRYIDSSCQYDKTFKDAYAAANGAHAYKECGDQFKDPDGTTYALAYAEGAKKHDRDPWYSNIDERGVSHVMTIASHSACTGKENSIEHKEGANYFVVAYVLEGGAVYCVGNS